MIKIKNPASFTLPKSILLDWTAFVNVAGVLFMENQEQEIWKDVVGWEDLYQVSSFGRVVGLQRTNAKGKTRNCVLRKPVLNKYGYPTVCLYPIVGKLKNVTIHRLVAKAFIPNPNNKSSVNHINGVKTDNNIKNLEWATVAENNRHAIETGLSGQQKKVVQYDLQGNKINVFTTAKEAYAKTGVYPTLIYRVVIGINKTSHGFIWKRE